METTSTVERLLRLENEELRSRLTEAEDTLNAIRSGEVDAIVVAGPGGEQVFSLASAETPYRIIVEEMNEGAVSLSKNGTILYCNRRCAELLALKQEQIVGSKFTRFVAEIDRPKFQSLLKTTPRKKCNGVISCLIHKSDPLHFLLSFSPIPSDILGDICIMISDVSDMKLMEIELRQSRDTLEQKVSERTKELTDTNDELTESRLAILNMMEDIIEAKNSIEESNTRLSKEIAERKLAMAALKESEEKFQGYFELPLIGRCITSPEKGWIEVNHTLCDMLGYTETELMQLSWAELTYPEDLPSDLEQFNRVVSGEIDHYTLDKRFFHKKGKLIYTHLAVQCVRNPNNTVNYFIAIIIDLTESKKAEEEINRINNKLISLNAEKDKLFSIISHDLRGPFNGFLGLFRIMEEQLPTMRLNEIQKITQTMGKSAKNLYSLLENLLDWSRMERGLFEFKPVQFMLMPKISDMLTTNIQSAAIKGIEISYDIPSDLEIIADENMFAGTLRNLTSNAVKFTPKDGKIRLAAKALPGNLVEISIKDSGIGMSREILSNLFHFDGQTSRKGTEGEPSTGLGLLLCKDFVEKHGGKIWVESEAGKGSTFYFTIPKVNETELKTIIEDISSDLKVQKQAKNLKILIVDDDEASRMILSIDLTKIGNTVLEAGTGVEAVEICKKISDIDLILMDLSMPEMDGLEATLQIRLFNKKVVIIAQTAFAISGYSEKAIEAGCNGYLLKPIDKDELTSLIRKHLI